MIVRGFRYSPGRRLIQPANSTVSSLIDCESYEELTPRIHSTSLIPRNADVTSLLVASAKNTLEVLMKRENSNSTGDRLGRSVGRLLYGTKAFYPLRSCYQSLFNRRKRAHRREMRELYAPFVRQGDLVFDVGANVGNYSEVFTELGARVVAVEPNPRCCENLRRLARARPVHVEECAVGDAPGKANLRVCESSTLSTLTDRWYEVSKQSPLLRDANWLGALEVNMVTLDQLAHRYGIPSFVKIDVEGYDDHVLRGMSFLPQALSFEYVPLAPEVAMRCLESAALAGRYQYNYLPEGKTQVAWESWVSAEALRERLASGTGNEYFGDVLARRIA